MSVRAKRRGRAASLVGAALVAILVTGCFPAPPPDDDGAVTTGQDAVKTVEDVFSANGIAIVEDVAEEWPEGALMASPMSAVDVMQAEVDSGGGLEGADLDDLVPMPEGAPPFSYVIAAWLSAPSTARAQAARAWLPGEPDWSSAPQVWYPRAALLLFVADAMEASLRDFGEEQASAPLSPGSPSEPAAASASGAGSVVIAASVLTDAARQGVPDAPCSAVSGFFTRTIDRVFAAVQLPPDFLAQGGTLGAISGFLAALYNTAVELAKRAVLTVVASLTAPVLHAIGSAVAIVGVVSHLSTYVLGVSVTVSTDRLILLDGREGFWTLLVDANRPLEPQLVDCLAALGQKPLAKIVEPGSQVTWHRTIPRKADGTVFGRVTLLYTALSSTVDTREAAVLPWTAAVDIESAQPAQNGTVGIRAELPKGDVARLITVARTLLAEAIAGIATHAGPLAPEVEAAIRQVLAPVIDRIEAEVLGAGRSVLMIVGSGSTFFEYREPDPPSGPAGAVTAECFVGSWRFDGLVSSNWIDLRRGDLQRLTLEIGADGLYAISARGSFAGSDADYEGSTSFRISGTGEGTWSVAASDLTTRFASSEFGPIVLGRGLSPTVFSCGSDGTTLTITGKTEPNYGATVWRFRRG